MSTIKTDKPCRFVQLDTGMAMTLSCSPARDADPAPAKTAASEPQQRGTAK